MIFTYNILFAQGNHLVIKYVYSVVTRTQTLCDWNEIKQGTILHFCVGHKSFFSSTTDPTSWNGIKKKLINCKFDKMAK